MAQKRRLANAKKAKSKPAFANRNLAEDAAKNPSAREQEKKNIDIFGAAYWGDAAKIRRLLKAGAKIDSINDSGWTPLICAIRGGKVEACKLLIDEGASIWSSDDRGKTPLMYAANRGRTEICKLLIQKAKESGMDLKRYILEDLNGRGTAFTWAALSSIETFRFLIQEAEAAGGDVKACLEKKDNMGMRPLDHAVSTGHTDTAAFLKGVMQAYDFFGKDASMFRSAFYKCIG